MPEILRIPCYSSGNLNIEGDGGHARLIVPTMAIAPVVGQKTSLAITAFGVTGSLNITVRRATGPYIYEGEDPAPYVDLSPALSANMTGEPSESSAITVELPTQAFEGPYLVVDFASPDAFECIRFNCDIVMYSGSLPLAPSLSFSPPITVGWPRSIPSNPSIVTTALVPTDNAGNKAVVGLWWIGASGPPAYAELYRIACGPGTPLERIVASTPQRARLVVTDVAAAATRSTTPTVPFADDVAVYLLQEALAWPTNTTVRWALAVNSTEETAPPLLWRDTGSFVVIPSRMCLVSRSADFNSNELAPADWVGAAYSAAGQIAGPLARLAPNRLYRLVAYRDTTFYPDAFPTMTARIAIASGEW